jgi:hypothetical protein
MHPLLQAPAPAPMGGPGGGQMVMGSSAGALTLQAPTQETAKRSAYAALGRESRRIHVSHIPAHLGQDDLKELFRGWSESLRRQMIEEESGKKLAPTTQVDIDYVLDIFSNNSGSIPFAFVELTTDDMADRFYNVDGIVQFPLLNGGVQVVKVRRPRDYKPMNKLDGRNVIMLGIHNPDEQEEMFRQLFGAFGDVRNFSVIPGRGCYVEYKASKSAQAAITALHGEEIGGHAIIVQIATEAVRAGFLSMGMAVTGLLGDAEDTEPESFTLPTKNITADMLNVGIPIMSTLSEFVKLDENLAAVWPVVMPTRILVLLNMVDKQELEDDDSYAALVEDVSAEVERFGCVEKLLIPRHLPRPPLPPEDFVPPQKPAAPVGGIYRRSDAHEWEAADVDAADVVQPAGSGTIVDPSGLSNAAYQHDLHMWQAACRFGEDQFELDTQGFRHDRILWEQDCLHPVHGVNALGRIFVEYASIEEAEQAQGHLRGRLFSGRTIVTSFLFEDVLYPPPEEDEDEAAKGGAEDGAPAVVDGDAADAAAAAGGETAPETADPPVAANDDID